MAERALQGRVAVITGAEVPNNLYGGDQPVLADKK